MEDAMELVASLVNEALADGADVVPVELAERIEQEMRTEHPAEHAAFLDAMAGSLYSRVVRDAYQSRRQHARSRAREFATVADSGDVSIFTTWRCRVDEAGTQRAIGDMTGPDNLFVAESYATDAARASMLEAFHRAVAKKVGKRKVSDVFAVEEFIALYRSIAGVEAPLAMAA